MHLFADFLELKIWNFIHKRLKFYYLDFSKKRGTLSIIKKGLNIIKLIINSEKFQRKLFRVRYIFL